MRFAGSFEVRVGTWRQRDWNNLCHVRTALIVLAVDGPIIVERAADAAVIIHDDIGVLPLATEFNRRAVISIEV